jgi:hypothetical protein
LQGFLEVGAAGFEPATSCSQTGVRPLPLAARSHRLRPFQDVEAVGPAAGDLFFGRSPAAVCFHPCFRPSDPGRSSSSRLTCDDPAERVDQGSSPKEARSWVVVGGRCERTRDMQWRARVSPVYWLYRSRWGERAAARRLTVAACTRTPPPRAARSA